MIVGAELLSGVDSGRHFVGTYHLRLIEFALCCFVCVYAWKFRFVGYVGGGILASVVGGIFIQ